MRRRLGKAQSEINFKGIGTPPKRQNLPSHPPAGEADPKPDGEGGVSEYSNVAVADGKDERPHRAFLDGGEGRVVEGDHWRVVVRFGKGDVPFAACPEFVGSGGAWVSEPRVVDFKEVGLVGVAAHGIIITIPVTVFCAGQKQCRQVWLSLAGEMPLASRHANLPDAIFSLIVFRVASLFL